MKDYLVKYGLLIMRPFKMATSESDSSDLKAEVFLQDNALPCPICVCPYMIRT